MSDEGFLSRWARRKAQVKEGTPVSDEPAAPAGAAEAPPGTGADGPAGEPGAKGKLGALEPAGSAATMRTAREDAAAHAVAPAPPLPTMDDVAQLTRASDYSRFVGTGVDRSVSNAAMKKLFSDPHFNVMDGLDVYIDDYGKPDPIPESMLRRMTQSKRLGLFDDETPEADATSDAAKAPTGSAGTEAVPSDAEDVGAAGPGAAPPDGDAGDRREAGQETGDANGVAPAAVAPATAPLASTDGTAPPRLPQSETAPAGGEPEDLLR